MNKPQPVKPKHIRVKLDPRTQLHQLLEQVASGQLSTAQALTRLRDWPAENLGFATLDHHRPLRKEFAEVVYCAGKTPTQVATIFTHLAARGPQVLGTRATPEHAAAVKRKIKRVQYDPIARTLVVNDQPDRPRLPGVMIVAAGTSDLPVAGEAVATLQVMGHEPAMVTDVGVAGLHRLMPNVEAMRSANVLIVVAGMEGALPSVVGGLVGVPIIAVPTSVGYGASFHGLSALLGMLNSCAPGLAVVNIDNGFGAGYLAGSINRRIHQAATNSQDFSVASGNRRKPS